MRTVRTLLVGLCLTACAGTSGAVAASSATVTAASAKASASHSVGGVVSGLVGRWAVQAAGEPATTRLIVDGTDGFQIFRHCGSLDGSWRAAASGAFVSQIFSGSDACFAGTPSGAPPVPWLDRATSFRSDPGRRLLLDANGTVLATLTPGGLPYVPATIARSEARVPVLTAAERRSLDRRPATLPSDLTAVTAGTITGTWLPVDGSHGYITLDGHHSYVGSDGCNQLSGSYAVVERGGVVATEGVSTAIGCPGVDVPDKMASASVAGFDGQELVLVGADGKVSVRLKRGHAPAQP